MKIRKVGENTFQFELNGKFIVAECYRLVSYEKKSFSEVRWIILRDRLRLEYLPETIAADLERMYLDKHPHLKQSRMKPNKQKTTKQLSLF